MPETNTLDLRPQEKEFPTTSSSLTGDLFPKLSLRLQTWGPDAENTDLVFLISDVHKHHDIQMFKPLKT